MNTVAQVVESLLLSFPFGFAHGDNKVRNNFVCFLLLIGLILEIKIIFFFSEQVFYKLILC